MPFWTLKKATAESRKKKKVAEDIAPKKMSASSEHTEKTHIISVTDSPHIPLKRDAIVSDTLKAFGDIIEHQDKTLVQKEDEIIRLRQQINECQEQLSVLSSVVKQLEGTIEEGNPTRKDCNRKFSKTKMISSASDDEYTMSSEDDWTVELGDSSEDDSTVSCVHIQPVQQSSPSFSRRSIRKNSIRSRQSIRSDSYHSLQRERTRSRLSFRGSSQDNASIVSHNSLQSVSLSLKSLPREIDLEANKEVESQGDKDDRSFHDDSCGKSEEALHPVESRRKKSRSPRRSISRKSIVSVERPKGQNSRQVIVENKHIVDPRGEKGVYSGALSKSSGMPNGKGLMEYEEDGRWYEGDWVHGRWTGQGRLSNGRGDFYEGCLKNDNKHGNGITRFADGRVFDGKHIRGKMIEGKMTYREGSVYQGPWLNGLRHGKGKFIFSDGSQYEGEFREGNFHGQGKFTWSDGGSYNGEWHNGDIHGRGKEVYPDGKVRHDGLWSRGQPIRC